MTIRDYDPDRDFDRIRTWVTDRRTHAMWCADRTPFPLVRGSFHALLREIAEAHGDRAFVAADDTSGDAEGFFCYSRNTDTKEGMLKFVLVDPEKRGHGLGRTMLRLALRGAFAEPDTDAVQLMVFSVNAPARRCYAHAGFRLRNTAEHAFRFGEEDWDRCNMVIRREEYLPD